MTDTNPQVRINAQILSELEDKTSELGKIPLKKRVEFALIDWLRNMRDHAKGLYRSIANAPDSPKNIRNFSSKI